MGGMRGMARKASAFRKEKSRMTPELTFFVCCRKKRDAVSSATDARAAYGKRNEGPPTIRELAEQTFLLHQEDMRENSARRQRDDTLFRRSIDPSLTKTRDDNIPNAGSIPKFTKDGIIQSVGAAPVQRDDHLEQDITEQIPEQRAPIPVLRKQTPDNVAPHCAKTNPVVVVLVVAAFIG